jgi:ribosomal protein S18 acetylase RimI-like enzyme
VIEILLDVPGVELVKLREAHIEGIIKLMNREGWYYYDHHELERYISLNQDCFTLFRHGEIVGSIFTTNYGNQAWIGNIVIAKEARGLGLATKMIRGVIDYLQENSRVRTFRLGSVPLAIGLYKKVGFHAEAFTTSQEVELPLQLELEAVNLEKNLQVERVKEEDLEAIADIDERFFKSNRLPFLKNIYSDSIRQSCFCLKDQGKLVGFLMIRRRKASKEEGHFSEGPDHAYRLGPSIVLPKYGISGFQALFQQAIEAVNDEVRELGGSARMYAVFPKSAKRDAIYEDTRELAEAMGMESNLDLNSVFDEHDHIFGVQHSEKNEQQWRYMKSLGFHQEYFEQVMSYSPEVAEETRAEPEGIFAFATPGDKA